MLACGPESGGKGGRSAVSGVGPAGLGTGSTGGKALEVEGSRGEEVGCVCGVDGAGCSLISGKVSVEGCCVMGVLAGAEVASSCAGGCSCSPCGSAGEAVGRGTASARSCVVGPAWGW